MEDAEGKPYYKGHRERQNERECESISMGRCGVYRAAFYKVAGASITNLALGIGIDDVAKPQLVSDLQLRHSIHATFDME
jgi:Ca2+/Na+ antiporter